MFVSLMGRGWVHRGERKQKEGWSCSMGDPWASQPHPVRAHLISLSSSALGPWHWEPHPRSCPEAWHWAFTVKPLCFLSAVTSKPPTGLGTSCAPGSSTQAPQQLCPRATDSGPRGGHWERFSEFQWPWEKNPNLINISIREKKDLTDKIGLGWSQPPSGGISGISQAPRPPQPGPVSRQRLSVPPRALGESEMPQLWPCS